MTDESNAPQTHRRALLWTVLVISAVANAAASMAGLSAYISAGFGLLTLACGATLIFGRRKSHERPGSRD
ncbi:hypothetical protein [Amycolatopsis sp. lyj-90]|uniref:hypothetical protein n=1 Tax=Amycolatopsis sp. lyj-90 TaxID=2789285 RepID=UPI00397BC329